jgi:hypothetical protein
MTCRQEMINRGDRMIPRSCSECGIGRCKRGLDEQTRAANAALAILARSGGALALLASIAGKKVYVAGPMRGIPEFNFPAFHAAATALRSIGCTVFNPAERDNETHGTDISKGNATGDEAQATKDHGFNLRDALGDDMAYICKHAEAIALLPGWQNSKGAKAERATADALGLIIVEL